jgi:hypothetical protein
MTEKVITTIITTAGVVAVAIIGGAFALFQNRKSKVDLREKVESALPVVPLAKVSNPTGVSETVERRIKSTHEQIADAIEASPLFHRDKIEKNFVGMRIRLPLRLVSIRHSDAWSVIRGEITEKQSHCEAHCQAISSNAEALILAQEGWLLDVDGEIEYVSRYYTKLKDCFFTNIRPPEPTSVDGGESSSVN